ANQRTRNEWTVTKYDGLGRAVLTGLWNNGGTAISRTNLQAQVNGVTTLWETRNGTAGNGYTNAAWPTTAIGTTLSLHYYDNYNLPLSPPAAFKPTGYSTATQGLATATLTKVLGAGTGTANMLWEVMHYDALGQVVRLFRQHYKGAAVNATNYDDIADTYTFSGRPEKSVRNHYATGAATVTVTTEYSYDHRDRLVDTWKTVKEGGTQGARTLIARNEYNEIGQLKRKNLHGTAGGYAQSVAYGYNERGWLRTAEAGLFKQELQYNTGTVKYHNGNIAYQVFKRRNLQNTEVTETYSYGYDRLNRLTSGTLGSGRGKEELSYDRLGNIQTLKRTGTSSAYVDDLLYTYTSKGQLGSVKDALTGTA
ncbi:hypothetical protein RYH73_26550, partial [Olivibacter sp. CPCC 100613]